MSYGVQLLDVISKNYMYSHDAMKNMAEWERRQLLISGINASFLLIY